MRKKYLKLMVCTCFLIFIFSNLRINNTFALETKAVQYSISPTTKPYKGKYLNYSTYNKNTKYYYLIRSYLEELEKKGGGTLTLQKGKYVISNTLYIPSNVTIRFKDGVVIEKGIKTGTSSFKSSKSIFQLVSPSKYKKKGVYGKYEGEKNIKLIGEGSVIIDLKYYKDSIAIVAGHNKNIVIENIKFKNMYSGHFIELDATDKVLIKNNEFKNSKPSDKQNKEGINIDTPDRLTKGWSNEWSKFDKTPNKNVVIENNKFYNLDRAIGTHKYSGGKYHENIIIRYNTINTTRQDAIRVMNWKNSTIENNKILNIDKNKGKYRAILASGAINPTFRKNTIENISRPIQFMPWKNAGAGSQYSITYNNLSNYNKAQLKTNKVKNVNEAFIRINAKYNVFDTNTEKIYLNN